MTSKFYGKKEPKADLLVWNMTRPLPYQDEFFDAALAVRVIHHTNISNITKIVHELDRVLKPKGFLFLQVPSYESETLTQGRFWLNLARLSPEEVLRRTCLTISSRKTSF
jgi:ubiquinone/menaquinone biosynthesis C-methylase UbiE